MSGIDGLNPDVAMPLRNENGYRRLFANDAKKRGPSPFSRPAGKNVAQAVQTAKDFESVLLHKVMEEMRKTVPDSGLMEEGTTQQVQGIFWFHLAQEMANQGGVGLWKDLYRQMTGQAPPATLEQVR